MNQEGALEIKKSNNILGCVRKSSRSLEVISHVSSALGRSYVKHCVPFWATHCKKAMDLLKQVQCRAQIWLIDWSIFSVRIGWENWDLPGSQLHPFWRREGSGRYFINLYKYLMWGGKEDWSHMSLSGIQVQDKWKWAQTETRKWHLNLSKWGWPNTWAFAKRFCRVPVLGGFPNLIWYSSVLSDIVVPALCSTRWTRQLPEIPTSLSSYVCIILSDSPCSRKWNTSATYSFFSWLPWMQISFCCRVQESEELPEVEEEKVRMSWEKSVSYSLFSLINHPGEGERKHTVKMQVKPHEEDAVNTLEARACYSKDFDDIEEPVKL